MIEWQYIYWEWFMFGFWVCALVCFVIWQLIERRLKK